MIAGKTAFAFLLAFFLLPASYLSAADDSLEFASSPPDKEGARAWSTSLEETWLPDSGLRDGSGGVTIDDTRAGFARRFALTPGTSFSAGLGYSVKSINAPAGAMLPNTLQSVSLRLGANHRINNRVTLGFMAAPGLRGDFKGSISSEDFRLPIAAVARVKVRKTLTITGGLAYNTAYLRTRAMPVFGLNYRPDDHWAFDLGSPRTAASYRLERARFYLSGEFGGSEYHLGDTSFGTKFIRYRDNRVIAGVDYRLAPGMGVNAGAGYSFDRRFTFADSARSDLKIENTPFAKVALAYRW